MRRPWNFDQPPCPTCNDWGQVPTRHETHTYATIGHPEWSKTLSFWACCSDCERGRRMAQTRARKLEAA